MQHEEIATFPKWFLHLEIVSIVVLFIFSILSFLVYFVEIQIIFSFRKTTFRGPFYRLMFVGIIVDMLSAINIFTGQIIPARRYFEGFLLAQEDWLGSVFFFVTYGGRCVQGATATILSFCRVSAVCAPVLYRKLGQPTYLWVMQFFQLSGLLVAGYLLIPRRYIYIFQDDGWYSVDDQEDNLWFYDFAALLELFFVFSIVMNNLLTYCMFRNKFKKKTVGAGAGAGAVTGAGAGAGAQNKYSIEKQKRESSLDKMTFIVCLVELIYFAFVVYSLQINQEMNKRVFYFLYNILCVVYSTFSAWMLLCVSKPITMQFRQRFTKFRVLRSSRSFSISVQGSQGNNVK